MSEFNPDIETRIASIEHNLTLVVNALGINSTPKPATNKRLTKKEKAEAFREYFRKEGLKQVVRNNSNTKHNT